MIDTEKTLKELGQSLTAAVDHLRQEFKAIRTNRPTPELIENVVASYYEQKLPVKQLAALSIRPPREIVIQPWDAGSIPAIQKAIEEANLGLSVQRDDNVIRAFLPALTDERRTELGKVIKKMAEEVRIQVRHLRDEENKKIKAAEVEKTLSQDQAFKTRDRIQKAIDQANTEIDEAITKKIEELAA